ncbi:MAG: DegT/DnrJ/EryC1/StrS family aminotransferase, partial [Actinomycetes bacterium]
MSDVLDLGGPVIGAEEREAVDRVLRSGRLAQGAEVEAFERELTTELSGTRFAVAVASGTAALDLALAALGVGEGDEVVTTPFTFPATVNAVLRSGATVRFADIGDDFLLDPLAVAAAVTHRTALILAVHLYGLP